MVASGLPALPTEWVYKLVTLNNAGQVIHSTLLAQDSHGNKFMDIPVDFAMDGHGNLAVTRQLRLGMKPNAAEAKSFVAAGVYHAPSGTWKYQQAMTTSGVNTANQLLGYGNAAVVKDTLFFAAQCYFKCTSFTSLYPLKVPGLSLDYPRSAVLGRSPRTPSPYLALGDSYSSGEGNPLFEAGTATPDINTCHRSAAAYPQRIAGTSTKIPPLKKGAFRACSGAVTSNITDVEQWNEGTQLDLWPDASTKLVTLTIGGNNIGFGDFAYACVMSVCYEGTDIYATTRSHIDNDLGGELTTAYKAILKMAPNAKVYVVGYPRVVGAEESLTRCGYLVDPLTDKSKWWGDARAARDILKRLNERISDTVNSVDPKHSRLRFVDVNKKGSPFISHGSSTPTRA